MVEKPLLTISLLCSGRPETKKSLDSLKVLQERVLCELILVDTGCDGRTKELLYTYTDKVISFTWCNDFAKARNAGLEQARGKWFMFLDDDEWFLDTKAIEEFFLSGEYKRYGYAEYIQRNYLDDEGLTYEDDWVERLACLESGIKFQGIIHECFTPMQRHKKRLSSVAEHYGYAYRTSEDEKKHAERNLMLLQKTLSENLEDARMWCHLLQEYCAIMDYENLKLFSGKALQKFENRNDIYINKERGCFYCGLLEGDIGLKDYKAAQRDYERAVADNRNTDYCMARLAAYGAEAYACNNTEKEELCCKHYLAIWEKYKTKQEELIYQETIFVRQAFAQIIWNQVYCHLICLGLKRGDTSSLKNYFDMLGWEKHQVFMTEQFIPCLIDKIIKLPYEEYFGHIAEILVNKYEMDIFWEEVNKIEEKKSFFQMIKIFSEMKHGSAGSVAVKLKKMMKAEKEDDWEKFSVTLKEAVAICPQFSEILKRYAGFYGEKRLKAVGKENRMKKANGDSNIERTIREGKSNGKQILSAEMQALAVQIKAQIKVLISQGMKQEALQVLNQLKFFMPDDESLKVLEKQILE